MPATVTQLQPPPTLFGKPMQPEPTSECWTAQFGLVTARVGEMLGGGFRGSMHYGSRFEALNPHGSRQGAAAECEAWLMRTILETAGAMGFELRRVES
jgi:hypothetical protein